MQVVKEVFWETTSDAALEAAKENHSTDIDVAVDRSSQKRSCISLNGIVSVTCVAIGNVVDIEVMSWYWECRDKSRHDNNCAQIFPGFREMKEVEGALNIRRPRHSQQEIDLWKRVLHAKTGMHWARSNVYWHSTANVEGVHEMKIAYWWKVSGWKDSVSQTHLLNGKKSTAVLKCGKTSIV